jgi:hypothetical protein
MNMGHLVDSNTCTRSLLNVFRLIIQKAQALDIDKAGEIFRVMPGRYQ